MEENQMTQAQIEREANRIIFSAGVKAMGDYPVLTRKKLAYRRRIEDITDDPFGS